MVEASKLKLYNNIDRIVAAILLGKDLNPPNTRLSYPCSICNRNCLHNSIQCDNCDKWCHIKCDGTNEEEYEYYCKTGDEIPFQNTHNQIPI